VLASDYRDQRDRVVTRKWKNKVARDTVPGVVPMSKINAG